LQTIGLVLFLSISTYFLSFFLFAELYLLLGFILISELILDTNFRQNKKVFFVILITIFFLTTYGWEYNNSLRFLIIPFDLSFFTIVRISNRKPHFFSVVLYSLLAGFGIFLLNHIANYPVFTEKLATLEINYNRVGGYILSVTPWILYSVLSITRKRFRFFPIIVTFLFLLFCLYLTNSKACWISFVITLTLLSFLYFLENSYSGKSSALRAFVLSSPILFFFLLLIICYYNFPNSENPLLYPKFYSSLRFELWVLFGKAFASLPSWLQFTGVGEYDKNILPHYIDQPIPDQLISFLSNLKGQYVHSHNLWIEILISFGYLGLVFTAILLWKIGKSIVQQKSKLSLLQYTALFSSLAILIAGGLDYLLDNINIIILLSFNFAVLTRYKFTQTQKEVKPYSLVVSHILIGIISIFSFHYLSYTNKMLSTHVSKDISNPNCSGWIVSLEKLESIPREPILLLTKKIENSRILKYVPNNLSDPFYASLFHGLYLQTKDPHFARTADHWYSKCYLGSPYPKTCKNLREELYQEANWDIQKIPLTKIHGLQDPIFDLYSNCSFQQSKP
jgi:hypothetical protein